MSKPLRVLMLEDNPSDAELALRELRHAGFEPDSLRVETEVDFLKALDLGPDLILADYGLPYFDGLSALDLLIERKLDIPFILLSGSIGDELAVEAIKKGATDYLLKDRLRRLGPAVVQALDRKQKQTELEKERLLLRTIVDALPDRIYALDLQGRKILSNKVDWQASGGKTMEDVIGKTDVDSYPPELAQQYWTFNKAVLDSGVSLINHEEPGLDSNGKPVIILTSRVPMCDAQGKVIGLVGIGHDITKRKQNEEALRESEGRYKNLFEDSPIALWEEDFSLVKQRLDSLRRDGITNFEEYFEAHPEVVSEYTTLVRVRDVNKVAMRLFQANRKEDLLGSLAGVLEGEALQGFRDELVRMAEGATNFSWEGLNRTLEDKLINISMHWSVVPGYENSLSRTIVSLIDITQRERAAARMQQQLEHLTALSTIDRVISANFDLRLSLSEILTHVMTELGVDAADVLVLNFASQILEYGAERGFRTQAIRKAQVRLGENYAGRIAADRQPFHIPDLRNEPDHLLLTTLLKGEDFVSYYGLPLIAKGQVNGVLEVFHRSTLEADPEWLDFLNTLAGQAAIAIENSTLFEKFQRSNLELKLAYDATIEGWSRALDLRDKETEGHTQHVTEITVELARTFGLSEAELVQVRWGALLHDIGKMGVPDGILLKPGPLTDEEWLVMKKHPTFAYEMLSPIRYLRLALDIPYCHHEKFDGSGYPRGLKGDQIPLVARIFAVVDVWDALLSDRPYRAAWKEEKVREHIRTSSGTQFDPQVVDAFLQMAH